MNKTLTAIAAAMSIVLSGCGEAKIAEEYARKMNDVLASYRRQVEAKIRAEQQSYVELAKAHDAADQNSRAQALDVERNSQATAFADEILQAAQQRKVDIVSSTAVIERLRKYADADFAEAEKRFAREADAYKKALTSLEDLTVEQERLERLAATLTTLAKPRSAVEQLKMLAQFGCDVNRNFQLLEVKRQLESLTQATKAQNAEKTKKSAESAAAGIAPEKKKALEDEVKQIDAKIAAIAKQSAAATAEQTKLNTPCK